MLIAHELKATEQAARPVVSILANNTLYKDVPSTKMLKKKKCISIKVGFGTKWIPLLGDWGKAVSNALERN